MGRTITAAFGATKREGHDASSFYKRKIYSTIAKPPDNAQCIKNEPTETNKLYLQDSSNMQQLPDNCIHLMIMSPPYNVGKEYEADLSLQECVALLVKVLQETYRVLVQGGRACVNIANVGRKPYIPLHLYVLELTNDLGDSMRGEIIWTKGASAGNSCAWGNLPQSHPARYT